MNQLQARTTQIYILVLSILAIYFCNLETIIAGVVVGWVLQGISLETLIHRKYAHNQFNYKNIFWEVACYIILLSTSLGRPYEWSYGHRVHHRYTDQLNDPQSPHSIGILKTFFSVFPAGAKGWDGIDKDLRSQPRLMFFNKHYYKFYILYNIIWFTIDPVSALCFIGIPSLLAWLTLGIINTISHLEMYKPKDILFPLWFWGGNYHGTHHKFPNKTYLGPRDLSYFVIKIIGTENEK